MKRSLLVGKPEGRTLKALRERIEKLFAFPGGGGAEGSSLQRSILVSRGGRSVANLPGDIFQGDWDTFENGGVMLPVYLCQVLVGKSAAEEVSLLQWDQY